MVTYRKEGIDAPVGQRTVVQIEPRIFRGRMTGFLFETDKTFVLEGALPGIRGLATYYAQHNIKAVVVSGHADRVGGTEHNRVLSEERARSVAAYLRNDVELWMQFYRPGRPGSLPWGMREDLHMLSGLSDASGKFYTGSVDATGGPAVDAAYLRFQQFATTQRGAAVPLDGKPGRTTREALVLMYMDQDGTTLPADVNLQTHGCGEFHNEVPTADGVDEPRNRRVEVFFFDTRTIDPPPAPKCAAPGCAEYPQWVLRSVETVDLTDGPPSHRFEVRLVDLDGQPLARAPFRLRVGGLDVQDTTGDDGVVAKDVPLGHDVGSLVVGGHDFVVLIGDLAAIDDVAGTQARLNNLGYDCGGEDGQLGPGTTDAIQRFQTAQGLAVTGVLDAPTRQKLIDVFGQ